MPRRTPSSLLLLVLVCTTTALAYSESSWRPSSARKPRTLEKRQSINHNVDGTPFLWLPLDEYSGDEFFDTANSSRWDFFTGTDPTNGQVNYVTREVAEQKNLIYRREDGTIVLKGDNETWLDRGVKRDSVRISTKRRYNTGLFILDLRKAPWGCGTWPAFWTLGEGQWPYSGEIDIIEGVHDNQHNQVAWHTAPGCVLRPNATFTGSIVNVDGNGHTDCNGLINFNSGCGIVEWSRASYGPYFDEQGGGVFAMKWDENGIAVWSFYRSAIPGDILAGTPHPDSWGPPSAALDPSGCDPLQFFRNHTIILNITFCGDWAGNSYATSGCPGTCMERLQDPTNFENATWIINSFKVYRKQTLSAQVSGADDPPTPVKGPLPFWASLLAAPAALLF